ncbi:hypothetical protein [Advenella kashmirensis]|uniref:hypothetical protein n=1 Tax=Advenella kashmirensis TaxID=310575 RepID=UPI0012DD4C91|nr:hypothetical protein [Advenella kashmirensis]
MKSNKAQFSLVFQGLIILWSLVQVQPGGPENCSRINKLAAFVAAFLLSKYAQNAIIFAIGKDPVVRTVLYKDQILLHF